MSAIIKYLDKIDFQDQHFVGTITFKSEEIALPDESKMALGIDGGHWVLVYQRSPHGPFQMFKYDQREEKIFVDQKPGGAEEIKVFKKHLGYFLGHAEVEDLVTLLPPRS
jgi:hypothetical protein